MDLCRTLLLLAISTASFAQAQEPQALEPVQVTLVAEDTAIRPGQTAWIGLRLVHGAGWHTYWRNPGDSGLPTKVRFDLPEGFTVDDIAWPAPQRFDVGGLYNAGYDGDSVLPIALHVPPTAAAGSTLTIRADVAWLACREDCIPGKASVDLAVPVSTDAAAPGAVAAQFSRARASVPHAVSWKASARRDKDHVIVTLDGDDLPPARRLEAFVVERKVVGYAPPAVRSDGRALEVRFPLSEYFEKPPASLTVVLVQRAGEAARAWQVSAPFASP
ncbi:protein-disulfide reductase DsbD domain-containing protein [Tahibacter amnicola]|uniref:Protein-disulfide reductase DsbD family protein n=1 Tax=Tahibacter amnicola TaxID=2976241 RepID=A0ABY6BKG6_9GAMM|nr:protein-disulfide reductase DsbD domain-containing protein [Tahibacter amnicola]UXI70506.1 protein-disulfide reductase DsbD family protein [Tahibacter amnicola]